MYVSAILVQLTVNTKLSACSEINITCVTMYLLYNLTTKSVNVNSSHDASDSTAAMV